MPPAYQVTTVHGLAGLLGLESAWRESTDQVAATASFDWISVAARFTNARDIETICAHSGDRLVAALPLAVKPVRAVARRVLLGSDDHNERSDILCLEPGAAVALADALISQEIPISLNRIPSPSPLLAALRGGRRRGWVLRQVAAEDAPFLALDPTWCEPRAHLSAGRRSDLRRMQRRAEQMGSVTYEVANPHLLDLESLLAEALAVEEKSWKGSAGTAMSHDAFRGGFTRALAESACRSGALRLAWLRVDGEAAAMQICLVSGQSLGLIKIGYDAKFRRCSPGHLLIDHTIGYAARQHLTRFEFMGVAEDWIDVWNPHITPTVSVQLYPPSVRGRAAFVVDRVRGMSADALHFAKGNA